MQPPYYICGGGGVGRRHAPYAVQDQLTDTPCRNFLGIVGPSFITNAKGLSSLHLALAMFAAIDFQTGIYWSIEVVHIII